MRVTHQTPKINVPQPVALKLVEMRADEFRDRGLHSQADAMMEARDALARVGVDQYEGRVESLHSKYEECRDRSQRQLETAMESAKKIRGSLVKSAILGVAGGLIAGVLTGDWRVGAVTAVVGSAALPAKNAVTAKYNAWAFPKTKVESLEAATKKERLLKAGRAVAWASAEKVAEAKRQVALPG